ncbi:hypothetical protein LCGC14_0070120 [marine sediment metagenome]|uniref:Uncharacterized protein n=1 Tax=marine sediment metagenome TaxID=412755 RepID=A0A0F9VPL9_9ZZZZ|nr:hypothetical protein [Maribacter sp.]HDZ05369.1 hypothetical protein [Maribacter sp.]HEA81423.1 hypothetical protein [Maribacter sp.]
MKKSFLKFLLSTCILLSGVYSPLFANSNLEDTTFGLTEQFTSTTTNKQDAVVHSDANFKGTFGNLDTVLEIEAVEIEEEENENSFFSKNVEYQKTTVSYYLLSVLFLFSYFTNSNTLQKLFTFLPTADRRFVLYQVFRI